MCVVYVLNFFFVDGIFCVVVGGYEDDGCFVLYFVLELFEVDFGVFCLFF